MEPNVKTKGFTIIELLLVMAIITLVSALSIPYVMSYQSRNILDVAVNTYAQTLRRAQVMSRGVERDSSWGVEVVPGYVILYKGTVYASRDTAFDEKYEIGSNIVISGVNGISYSKLYGLPSATGTTTLTVGNDTKTVGINEKGTLTY